MSRRVGVLLVALAALTAACAMPSGPAGTGAPVQGRWQFVGTQRTPSAALQGVLEVEAQDGDLITGRANWDERDALGILRQDGGAMTGRVVGTQDVDFDVIIAGVARRHVGRLVADTMEGNWVQLSDGRTGTFRAVREP